MAKRSRYGELPTLDAHNDTIIRQELRGDSMDFAVPDPTCQVDLPRMKKGGIQAAFVMVGGNDLQQSLRLIDAMYQMCANHPGDFLLCRTAADVRRAFRTGRFALVMSIESQTMFGEQLALLRNWHRLGVRVATLTHGEGRRRGPGALALQADASFFGYLSAQERRTLRRQTKGLTAFGREALDAMAELGIALDLAHANDTVFWQALECFEGPVCYTHGDCYALCPHARNLTDDMMRALAQRGGVIGICFYSRFVDEKTPTLDRLVDHFMHALEIMGPDHVGIGTDFDGCETHREMLIKDASRLGDLWEALERRGVSQTTLRKIAHRNFLRMLP